MRQSFVLSGVLVGAVVLSGLGYYATTHHAVAPFVSYAEPAMLDPVVAENETDLSDSEEEVPGELAVDLRDDLSSADLFAIKSEYGLHPNSAWSEANDKLEVAIVPLSEEQSILERLSQDPRVEHVERMEVLRASFLPNDPMYDKQWHLQRVGAETAWEYSCGEGVTVAVIDTGVACFDKGPFSRGTDLAGTRCEGGYNFVSDSPEAYDDQGHGTHVAGTIAQTTNNGKGVAGLAYCARLMPIKVLNSRGWGTMANVAEGIRYAADNGAQVINMSLGGDGTSAILGDAVNHALSKGVVVVAAAGNSGRKVGYPAAYPGVIAVSATDSNDKIAYFSSRGPQIAIGAPGVNVTQQTICNGGRNKCEIFGSFSGTSMASPHVAGVATMLVGLGVSGPTAVRDALASGARAQGEPQLYGAGILSASGATANVFWHHLWVRALALLLLFGVVARHVKKNGGKLGSWMSAAPGAVFGAVGLLFFLPLVHALPRFGEHRWVAELLMRPLGEWDLVFDANLHRWLPLASALPAVVGTALLYGVKSLRSTLGGFALGSAALMAEIAVLGDVTTPFGWLATRLWLVANALVCIWIARVVLDQKKVG
jgi:serine protease